MRTAECGLERFLMLPRTASPLITFWKVRCDLRGQNWERGHEMVTSLPSTGSPPLSLLLTAILWTPQLCTWASCLCACLPSAVCLCKVIDPFPLWLAELATAGPVFPGLCAIGAEGLHVIFQRIYVCLSGLAPQVTAEE